MSHPLQGGSRLDGPTWKMKRLKFLAAHPQCAMCGEPATIVDHKQAHDGDPELFWAEQNWQGLCVRCHNRKTRLVDMQSKQTDNSYLRSKLALRRHFLREYGDDIRVMDCCQGSGRIWDTLRREFNVRSYWGLDVKPEKGRLKVDSSRVLSQSGWRENVIDIDTYGSPWRHWAGVCANLNHAATVFLTVGFVGIGGGNLCHEARAAMGLDDLAVPNGILGKLEPLSIPYCLDMALERLNIIEAREALPHGRARYFGVRLEPRT